MSKVKTFASLVGRAFGPIGTLISAVLAVLGEWSDTLFGPDTLSPFIQENLSHIGITLFVLCVAAAILRMEWRLREVDSYFGNEHRKRLMLDGIPPTRDEYVRYVGEGDYGVVNRFWLAGISNVGDHRNRTDLHVACEYGHAAIVQGILERGGDPKRQDSTGLTPLMASAIPGNVKVMDVLLQHDCALNAKSTHGGCSALFIASAYGHVQAIDLLLKHGADIDAVDHANLTPLMGAIAQSKWKASELLLDSRADAARVDSFGATTLDYAIAHNAPNELIQKLEGRGAKASIPALKKNGGGFSRYGHVRVSWERATAGIEPGHG